MLSRSLFSAFRRSPGLCRDPKLLHCVLAGCSSSDSITARHAFAVLKEQALVCVLRLITAPARAGYFKLLLPEV